LNIDVDSSNYDFMQACFRVFGDWFLVISQDKGVFDQHLTTKNIAQNGMNTYALTSNDPIQN
jgi:hypothetical protein